MESRLSQLLQITHCLNNCNNNWTFLFLEQLANELNHKSIGSLIASLLLNNQSILSNSNLQTLLKYSKNTCANSSYTNNDVIPLISLPKDVFDHMGLFIGKIDGMELGYCCHKLYHFTRTISFLHTSGRGHTTTLTCRMIQKIADTGYDPLIACINCHSLILCTGTLYINRFDISKLLNKIVNNSSYYSGWYKILFKNLNSIKMYENGAGLLSHLPMDILFGVEKLNKYTNEMEKINEKPLNITFGGIWKENMFEFFLGYVQYFNNVCNADLNKIRQIGWLSFESQTALTELWSTHTNYIELLHPNYLRFRMNGDLWLTSLKAFNIVLHDKLEEIQSQSCCFNFVSTMNEIYDIARKNGHVFNFQRLVISEIANNNANINQQVDIDLSDVIDDQDKQRLQTPAIQGMIERADGMLAMDSHNTQNVFEVLFQEGFDPQDTTDDGTFAARLYCIAVQRWVIKLIDNDKLNVIKTQNQTSLKRVTFSENLDHIYGATNILQNFYYLFKHSVFYHLLNWKNSVEYLGLNFFPKILNLNNKKAGYYAKDLKFRDGQVNFGYLEDFERALDNIFDENNFVLLKHVDIELHFGTKYANIELESISSCDNIKHNIGVDHDHDDVKDNGNINKNNDNINNNCNSVIVAGNKLTNDNSDNKSDQKDHQEEQQASTIQPNENYYPETSISWPQQVVVTNMNEMPLNGAKRSRLFLKEDFEQTIDWYINVYTHKVITNISKQFQRLKNIGFKISLTTAIGSEYITDSGSKIYYDISKKNEDDNSHIWDDINDDEEDDDDNKINIDEWLTPQNNCDESQFVKAVLQDFRIDMKQIRYGAKRCLKEQRVTEKCFVLSPYLLEIRD